VEVEVAGRAVDTEAVDRAGGELGFDALFMRIAAVDQRGAGHLLVGIGDRAHRNADLDVAVDAVERVDVEAQAAIEQVGLQADFVVVQHLGLER
jgi:hypothetical protein